MTNVLEVLSELQEENPDFEFILTMPGPKSPDIGYSHVNRKFKFIRSVVSASNEIELSILKQDIKKDLQLMRNLVEGSEALFSTIAKECSTHFRERLENELENVVLALYQSGSTDILKYHPLANQ